MDAEELLTHSGTLWILPNSKFERFVANPATAGGLREVFLLQVVNTEEFDALYYRLEREVLSIAPAVRFTVAATDDSHNRAYRLEGQALIPGLNREVVFEIIWNAEQNEGTVTFTRLTRRPGHR